MKNYRQVKALADKTVSQIFGKLHISYNKKDMKVMKRTTAQSISSKS